MTVFSFDYDQKYDDRNHIKLGGFGRILDDLHEAGILTKKLVGQSLINENGKVEFRFTFEN